MVQSDVVALTSCSHASKEELQEPVLWSYVQGNWDLRICEAFETTICLMSSPH